MESSVTATVTPIHMLLGLAVQLVFPIIIIRKINYLTDLLHEHLDKDQESS